MEIGNFYCFSHLFSFLLFLLLCVHLFNFFRLFYPFMSVTILLGVALSGFQTGGAIP